MTHIFIFNNTSRAANYGIGTYVRSLAEGLLEHKNVTVSFVDMVSDDIKEYTITTDERGCQHYGIPTLPSKMESEQYCRTSFYFLARHINPGSEERLVFQFNYFHHMPLAMLLKHQYFDCRIVLTVHYLGWCFELKGNKTQFHRLTAEGYRPQDEKEKKILSTVESEKSFLHLADEVLVLSKDTQRILTEDYAVFPEKLQLVYNGKGDALCLKTASDTPELRTVLYVGRLDEIKGLEYLIAAFKSICQKHPDVRLVIAGDGDFQRYLSQCRELSGRVMFMGKMSSNELDGLYQTATIGVMPSFHAQCSYTAIEMMRHGIPLIGTDSTGLAEMLDATPEFRVPIDEDNWNEDCFVNEISSRMDLLLSDNEAYRRASAAVSQLYGIRYRVSSMIRETYRAIEKSFCRSNYTMSPDFLEHIDYKMFQLIDQCPDIDTNFYGIGGIGVYLWRRSLALCERGEQSAHVSLIQEYLIYYLDWLREVAVGNRLPNESMAMLHSMRQTNFYQTCVQELLASHLSGDAPSLMPQDKTIIQNAFKICNCKI